MGAFAQTHEILNEVKVKMGTWDEILDKAKIVADTATKVTGEVVEISKNKLQAIKINSNLQKAYEKLGAAVYHAQKTNEDVSGQVALYVSEIDGLLVELKEVTARMNENKMTQPCSNCGYGNTIDSIYCAHCGAKMKKPGGKTDSVEYVEINAD